MAEPWSRRWKGTLDTAPKKDVFLDFFKKTLHVADVNKIDKMTSTAAKARKCQVLESRD